MRYKTAAAFALLFCAAAPFAPAARAATITTHEEEKYFYQGGRMEKFEGQYEHTYFFDPEKNILTRTRIFDYHTKKITPDETQYEVQRQLNSDPTNAVRFSLPPVIRGIAQIDADTLEILVIRDETVQTVTSHAGRVVVSNSRRLK